MVEFSTYAGLFNGVSETMISAEQLAQSFTLNLRIIGYQTEGLGHEDSLVQTDYNINSMNWVLGHLAVNRDQVLQTLGWEPLLSEGQTERYRSGSEPVTGPEEGLMSLQDLRHVLGMGQERIALGFERLTEADWNKEIQSGEHTITVAQHLFGLYFHDTYHTGQLEMLRQVAGTNDKVI